MIEIDHSAEHEIQVDITIERHEIQAEIVTAIERHEIKVENVIEVQTSGTAVIAETTALEVGTRSVGMIVGVVRTRIAGRAIAPLVVKILTLSSSHPALLLTKQWLVNATRRAIGTVIGSEIAA